MQLERARIPLRSAEAIFAVVLVATGAVLFAYLLTTSGLIAVAVGVAVPFILRGYLARRISARRKALKDQMPETLAVLSASLKAGHTLHRAIDSIARSGEAPVSEEFAQVMAETQLGNTIVEAVENMAQRVDLAEVAWLSRAITIQYSVGGRLADLLDNLAEITYSKKELQREVQALTAEGRASAWMLGLLPPALVVAIRVTNPKYIEPMFNGGGLVILGLCGVSVMIGVLIIRRMVEFEV